MLAAIELYKAKFGADSLPDTFGMDPEEATALLIEAVRLDKPLTEKRLRELGYAPAPAGLLI